MSHFNRALLLGLVALSWVGAGSARAAFFGIDDTRSDDNILFSANDFEEGISVGGTLLQQGLNNPGTVLLSEVNAATGQANRWDFLGTWITGDVTLPGPKQVAFIEPGSAAAIISDILFVEYTPVAGGTFSTISGYFISDASETGLDPSLIVTSVPVTNWPETNGAFDFSAPFLSASAQSDLEAPVPEAASILIWGLGLGVCGLAVLCRRLKTCIWPA